MCNFFSFNTKGNQKYYFNWEQRQQLQKNNPHSYSPDSHSSISEFHKLDDDKVNKYEYNPVTKNFVVDQINIKDDQALARQWVERLDFKKIIEPLIIKPIIHPFELPMVKNVTEKQSRLLEDWILVRDSVRTSVWASVRDSVGNSVLDSVRASVRASIGDSVWASVLAYTTSFFKIEHKKGINPLKPSIDLWEQGLVPSFDGKFWRLHSGKNAEIVYKNTLKKM